MSRVGLIDGDEIVYRIAYSCQSIEWCVYKDGERIHSCLNKLQAIESIGNDDDIYDLVPETTVHDDFVTELDNYLKGIVKDAGAKDFKIYLTGDNNFRKELATLLPYKGHRATVEKPTLYDDIRTHLLSDYDAEIIDYAEADDGIAMGQWGSEVLGDTILITQDKDLDMVPGYHFNPRKGETTFITPTQGITWFYNQLLTGDSTDNIPGIYNVGVKKAAKKLQGLRVDQMYGVVLKEYDRAFRDPKVAAKMPGDKRGEERVLEIARLLWMLQFEGQLWEDRCEYSIW